MKKKDTNPEVIENKEKKPKKEKPPKKEKIPKEKTLKEKAPKKEKTKKVSNSKNDNKIEQDKSQLAKDLNIRISSPYGYYPDDVDPIITKLKEDVANLTKENKNLRDKNGELEKNIRAVSTELAQLKMQVSLMEVPALSIEEGLTGISKIGNITGNNDDTPIAQLAAGLLDDEPAIEEPKKRPVIKLKSGGNK